MLGILLTLFIFGLLPWALKQPQVGVLLWTWIGLGNPHRLTWGFAHDFPFAMVIAIATLVGLVLSTESRRMPWNSLTLVWWCFIVWMCVTTLLAVDPIAPAVWERVMKIMLMALVTLALMQGRDWIMAMVWVVVLSLGFYGVKGGIWTLGTITGGLNIVWGPEGSFIEDNNALGLALLVVLPLMRFLQLQAEKGWVRQAWTGAMVLTLVAIMGTHSRGALVGGAVVAIWFWWRSAHKLRIGLAMAVIAAVVLATAPPEWAQKMTTIVAFQQDSSAMSRIHAWQAAINLTRDHPFVGWGFGAYNDEMIARYAPVKMETFDAHSIYFKALAEHGYVGLGLFVLLLVLGLRYAGRVARGAPATEEWRWARELAGMLQVSMVAFAAAGAFLSLTYFDLYYALLAMAAMLHATVEAEAGKSMASGIPRRPRARRLVAGSS